VVCNEHESVVALLRIRRERRGADLWPAIEVVPVKERRVLALPFGIRPQNGLLHALPPAHLVDAADLSNNEHGHAPR